MSIGFRAIVALMVLALFPAGVAAQSADGKVGGRDAMTSARIAKVIVGIRLLKAEMPASSTQSDVFREHEQSVMDLMHLLDRQSSRRDIQTLVNLSSYYLGEAPGQTLSCVMIRKGPRIRPIIDQAMKMPQSACMNDVSASLQERACLAPDVFKARLGAIAKAVAAGERCTDL